MRGPALAHHHRRQGHNNGGVSPRTLTFVIVVVTIVWAVNFMAGIVVDQWQGATGVNAVMMAAIGLLGAARFRQHQVEEPEKKELPPKPEEDREQ